MFTDEAIARAKLATLIQEEFNRKQAETNALSAKYGVNVKALEQAEQRLQKARAVSIGAAIAGYARLSSSLRSLRQAGLENTVEANRQHIAYQLLGREIAGIFMPATTASTNATIGAARALTGLNEKGQNLIFVLSSAATGLAAFSGLSLLASVSGLKLTGALAGIVKYLPLIGLAGGVLGGLAAIFLASNDGAKALEDTMQNLVKLANELGAAFDEAINNPGKFWDDFRLGLVKKAEDWGIVKDGAARAVFDGIIKPNAVGRNGLDERRTREANKRNQPTPGNYRFEGVSDAFERVQIAAAKQSLGTPEKQLNVAEKQLEELKKLNDAMPNRAGGIMDAGKPMVFGVDF